MILLVSNSRDYATDDVVTALRARGETYVRLDLDLLKEDQVILDPVGRSLLQVLPEGQRRQVSSPTSILYRAPTHLRESSGHRYSPEHLLERHQWAAFGRSLMIFRDALWINHPADTFAAENKPFQLSRATEVGFRVPRTAVANAVPSALAAESQIAVKALDSFLLRDKEEDVFFYTEILSPKDLTEEGCQSMPLIIQECLSPKTDIRITVVGDHCFCAETENVVSGDWRRRKPQEKFREFEAPEKLKQGCRDLLRKLRLRYGALDFARVKDEYYFLEVNPTGEWAWIDNVFQGRITNALVEALISG